MRIFENKKGFGRKPLSLILGLVFVIIGLIPLLNGFGVIPFGLPIDVRGVILWVLAIVASVILLLDSLKMEGFGIGSQLRIVSIVGGLLLLAVGLIPILHSFGVLGFTIPEVADTIKNVLFMVFGALLLYGGTQGF